MGKVAVITAATGCDFLAACAESVAAQSNAHVHHFVVVDGLEREASVARQLRNCRHKATVVRLPEVTGRDNFCGHRIYAAMGFVTNADWICYLDEDNWIAPNHIESLMRLSEKHGLQWAYSLRNVMHRNGAFACKDDCNSLGWWPSYDGLYHHVDTNCYFIRRDIAIQIAPMWNRATGNRTLETPDRAICSYLLTHYPLAYTTGLYTVNYRIGSRVSETRDLSFYKLGNKLHRSLYRRFPWKNVVIAGHLLEHPRLAIRLITDSASFRRINTAVKALNLIDEMPSGTKSL